MNTRERVRLARFITDSFTAAPVHLDKIISIIEEHPQATEDYLKAMLVEDMELIGSFREAVAIIRAVRYVP